MKDKVSLDQFALNIEFLVISVVQGIILSTIAVAATPHIIAGEFSQWPYIVSAFLIGFIFWSQAIIHALSFIDWPVDLPHSFLYFLASFVQVVAFSTFSNPRLWFISVAMIFVVAGILYVRDYQLIVMRKKRVGSSKEDRKLLEDVLVQHKREMYIYVPAGFLYNIICAYLIWKMPDVFIGNSAHLYLIGGQLVFEIIVLKKAVASFKNRATLIEKAQ